MVDALLHPVPDGHLLSDRDARWLEVFWRLRSAVEAAIEGTGWQVACFKPVVVRPEEVVTPEIVVDAGGQISSEIAAHPLAIVRIGDLSRRSDLLESLYLCQDLRSVQLLASVDPISGGVVAWRRGEKDSWERVPMTEAQIALPLPAPGRSVIMQNVLADH